jgi:RsiW-degrading membrane proteinase PrsW (M82 family)
MQLMHFLVILLAAALPTALYTLLLWWLDRYEKEPLHLLAVSFVWGAVPALVLAIGTELATGGAIEAMFGAGTNATLGAPIVEEVLKACALVGIFVWARREFNGVLDGIIYGALVGLGFSMSETVLYLLFFNDQLVATWWLRSGMFGFNHAFFSSIVGIGMGLVRYKQHATQLFVVAVALVLAIGAHMLHNTAVQAGVVGLGIAWIANSGGVLVVLATAVLSLRNELDWINTELRDEVVQGVLTRQQFAEVASPTLRGRAQLRTLVVHGWLPYRRLRRFHHLLTELAFVKYQLRQQDRYCCEDDVAMLRTAARAIGGLLVDEAQPVAAAERIKR